VSAQSFLVRAGAGVDPLAQLSRCLDAARSAVRNPTGALLFASGALARQGRPVAERVRERASGIPAVVVPAAGVLTERGEVEREAALAGIVWSSLRSHVYVGGAGGHRERLLPEPLGAEAPARPPALQLLFVGPEWAREHEAGALAAGLSHSVVGAGAVADPLVVTARGEIVEAPIAGLGLWGSPPLVEVAGAARLVTEFWEVGPVDDRGMVAALGGERALDRLTRVSPRPGASRQVVLAALLGAAGGEEGDQSFVLRPIRGLDEGKGALRIPGVAEGARVAFAVLDPEVAREGIERVGRSLAQAMRGAAPEWALLLTDAGRGSAFHGSAEAELRLLRARLPGLPIAGMQSAFELAGAPDPVSALALHAAVATLFRSPS